MLGIIQEQHPDRADLFMQWKEMDWPLLVDAFNQLEVPYVPITIGIDEYGIIRYLNPPFSGVGTIEEDFVAKSYPAPSSETRSSPAPPASSERILREQQRAAADGSWAARRDLATGLALWGGPDRLGESVGAWEALAAEHPDDGYTWFRLGVARRMRLDSTARRPEDFQRAVDAWSAALRVDPNNYIFRRRIEQYGPRLEKPYPFYDWIEQARADITLRGEVPVALAAEPVGAELAAPLREIDASLTETGDLEEPDPQGKLDRDRGSMVRIETTVVPPRVEPGGAVRVHLSFIPIAETHWNNEVGGLAAWVDPPAGTAVESHHHELRPPPVPVSLEIRSLDFEVRVGEDALPGPLEIPLYCVYYVCEGERGVCLYRRQDVPLALEVTAQ